MGVTRVQRTVPATLSHTWYVGETETDPTGTPTVAITAADGVSVQTGDATIVGSDSGQTTFAMSAVATLERLTVTWTATVAGTSRTEVDYVEIVGGFFFTLAEGRGSESSLSSTSTYPSAALEVARLEVEVECEAICDRAFVPRYQRVTLDGTGSSRILLEHSEPDRSAGDVRSIRSASIAPMVGETFVELTADQLAALAITDDGYLERTDGYAWTEGRSNVVVEYEYGLDAPPADLLRAALLRLRHRANIHRSGVPDNVISYSGPDGLVFRQDMPGTWKTGWPEVDAAYSRYSRRSGSGTGDDGRSVPASRTLSYPPQRYSLYHR